MAGHEFPDGRHQVPSSQVLRNILLPELNAAEPRIRPFQLGFVPLGVLWRGECAQVSMV